MAGVSSIEPSASLNLAYWAQEFTRSAVSQDASARVKAILLDTLGCALAGPADPTARRAVSVVKALGGSPECTVIGERWRTSAPLAAFANGVLVRAIEFNDAYAGPGQIGHPSDNIPAVLALAEMYDRSGREVLQTVRLGYEVYGRMLDISEPSGPWDHTSVSGVACALEAGSLMGLTEEHLAEAISLAAVQSAASREVRSGYISAAKSTAGAMVAQTAVQVAMLAAAGLTGPRGALDGASGFARQILHASNCSALWEQGGRERIFGVSLKAYPCFALAQGPVAAALAHRNAFPPDSVDNITLSFANCRPVSLRIPERSNWSPHSREAADHSLPYLTAAAWIDGRIDLQQFDNERWLDPQIKALMERIELRIDRELPMAAPGAYSFRLELRARDGRSHVEEYHICPGHPENPLSWADVKAKFDGCASSVLGKPARQQIIAMVESLEDLPSIRPLLSLLSSTES